MEISRIQSYLVEPGKGKDTIPAIIGTEISKSGRIFTMISDIFFGSDRECDIPIRFLMSESGEQKNVVHSLLVNFVNSPEQDIGRNIAERLSSFTTKRSKLGLLFLIFGIEGNKKKLLVSRFPAEIGIRAVPEKEELRVEFLEDIFMKSAKLYKAALFTGTNPEVHFWSGLAVDKQINASNYEIADYWIKDFLCADFKTNSKAGSKRMALAIREASRGARDLRTRKELTGVCLLLEGFQGKAITIEQLMNEFNLSEEARKEITRQLPYPTLIQDSFIFDSEEFFKHAAFASVELSNQGLLIAPSDRFEDCFQRELIDILEETYKFTTIGRIIDESVRGRR